MKTQILILVALFSLTLFSCQNFSGLNNSTVSSSEDAVLKSTEIAANDILIESISDELSYEAEFLASSERYLKELAHVRGGKHLMDGHKGSPYVDGYSPEITIDTADTGYPVVITIDYGDSTVLKNGRVITGLVTIEISAARDTDGATRTITYTNCVIDSVSVDGVSNEVFNGDNETTRTITSGSNITFVLVDGTVIDRVGNHVRNWMAGLDTPLEHDDDVIETTGSTEATTSTGNVWVREIIEPLVRMGDCRHHVQGIVQFSQNGEVLATLNYGDGECDNLAILTTNGEDIEIELGGCKPEPKLDDHGRGGEREKGHRNNGRGGN